MKELHKTIFFPVVCFLTLALFVSIWHFQKVEAQSQPLTGNRLADWSKIKDTARILLKGDRVGSFSEGLAPALNYNRDSCFIDQTGREVISLKDSSVRNFSEGLAAFSDLTKGNTI